MRRGLVFLCGLFCFCLVHGQQFSELEFALNKKGEIVGVPRLKSFELKIPKIDYSSYTPASTRNLDLKMAEIDPLYIAFSQDERPMNMQILSRAYMPFFYEYTPMLRRVSPMAFDFQEFSVTPLSENVGVVVSGAQYTWPGAGGMNIVATDMVLTSGAFTLVGGGFAGRYSTPFNPQPGYMVGANIHMMYDVADWMRLHGWGRYVYQFGENNPYNKELKGIDNPHMILNPFFPHTSLGGAVEFKINEKFGVGVGVNYDYNHWNKRFDRQFLFSPVFNTGRMKVGFY